MQKAVLLLGLVWVAAWAATAATVPPKGKAGKKAKAPAAKPARTARGHYMLYDGLDSLRVWKVLPRAPAPAGEGC